MNVDHPIESLKPISSYSLMNHKITIYNEPLLSQMIYFKVTFEENKVCSIIIRPPGSQVEIEMIIYDKDHINSNLDFLFELIRVEQFYDQYGCDHIFNMFDFKVEYSVPEINLFSMSEINIVCILESNLDRNHILEKAKLNIVKDYIISHGAQTINYKQTINPIFVYGLIGNYESENFQIIKSIISNKNGSQYVDSIIMDSMNELEFEDNHLNVKVKRFFNFNIDDVILKIKIAC